MFAMEQEHWAVDDIRVVEYRPLLMHMGCLWPGTDQGGGMVGPNFGAVRRHVCGSLTGLQATQPTAEGCSRRHWLPRCQLAADLFSHGRQVFGTVNAVGCAAFAPETPE
jgi:hypothetical protein